MKRLFYILLLLAFITGCKSQGSNKDLTSSPGYPAMHLSSAAKWMREPVSFVYQNGSYHLFYLTSDTAYGNTKLRQADSKDMVNWSEGKNAFSLKMSSEISYGVFVSDTGNTTGYKNASKEMLVAMLLVKSGNAGQSDSAHFEMGISSDSGNSWELVKDKISFPGKLDVNRKPSVVWDVNAGKWIMTITEFNDLYFYSSPDLKNWTAESTFSIPEELGAGAVDKATLLQIAGSEKHILLVDNGQGGINGGSWVQYFVGTFDGHNFVNQSKKIHVFDYGKDNYSNVVCSGLPQTERRTLLTGWMSNQEYSWKSDKLPWCGMMTITRELGLEFTMGEWLLTNKPVTEIQKNSVQKINSKNQVITGVFSLTDQNLFDKSPVEISLTFRTDAMTRMTFPARFGLRLENKKGESLTLGYDASKWCYFIDRSNLTFAKSNLSFGGMQLMPCYHTDSTLVMNMIIDNSSIELFTEGGKLVMTENFLTEAKFDKVLLFTDNGNIELIKGSITRLK